MKVTVCPEVEGFRFEARVIAELAFAAAVDCIAVVAL